MSELKIYKYKKESEAMKPMMVYTGTHEKLASLSQESGISMVKLLSLIVDYAIPRVVVVTSDEDQA